MTFGSSKPVKRYTYRAFVTVYAESEGQADELAATFEHERPDGRGSCSLDDGSPDVEEEDALAEVRAAGTGRAWFDALTEPVPDE